MNTMVSCVGQEVGIGAPPSKTVRDVPPETGIRLRIGGALPGSSMYASHSPSGEKTGEATPLPAAPEPAVPSTGRDSVSLMFRT